MKTVRQMHRHWAESVLPNNASQVQRQEMERAFYSGALTCFRFQIEDIAALSDADAEKAMKALQDELEDYFRLMRAIPGTHGTERQ